MLSSLKIKKKKKGCQVVLTQMGLVQAILLSLNQALRLRDVRLWLTKLSYILNSWP